MIVIENIAPTMPTRPRYPGGIDLPVLVPPSPPGSEVILPPKKTSSIWFFGILTAIVGAIAYAGSESPGSHLGRVGRKKYTNRLYYMYVPPGKWFEDAVSIPKKSLKDYQHRTTYTPGQLYYIWAESANTARYLLRTDKGIREHSAYEAILDVSPRPKPEPPKAKRLTKAEQLTLFSGNPLSGATANCLLWQEVESQKTGGLVWRCGKYGPSCDGGSCLPETYKFQTRTCVRTKKVPALSPRWNRKTVTRCAEYQRVCSTASCLDKPFDKPAPSPGHGLNTKRMIRDMARQMAEDKNIDEETAGKALGREIMDRGGIRQYRKGREKEEFKVIPLFMRRKDGLPPDEMASEMGLRDDSELFEAIRREYPGTKKTKRKYSAEDFMQQAEGYVWTAIEEGQVSGLGQDLFPGLRRELTLEPPEDIATSDDPVTACMERQGWKIPRMNQLKANIAWKLTPDLFTQKTTPLSPGEKEYQRVIAECLQARSGTAGALGARSARKGRITWNRGDLDSTIRAARKLAYNEPMYIFPTALGYDIKASVPPWLNHLKVHQDGKVDEHTRNLRTDKWTVRTIRDGALGDLSGTGCRDKYGKFIPIPQCINRPSTRLKPEAEVKAPPKAAPTPEKDLEPYMKEKPFTEKDSHDYNRYSHYTADLNEQFQGEIKGKIGKVEDLMRKYQIEEMPEAVKTAIRWYRRRTYEYLRRMIYSRNNAPGAAMVGPSNYNQRKHNKVMDADRKYIEKLDQSRRKLDTQMGLMTRQAKKTHVSAHDLEKWEQIAIITKRNRFGAMTLEDYIANNENDPDQEKQMNALNLKNPKSTFRPVVRKAGRNLHAKIIAGAMQKGLPIAPEVLAQYPNLTDPAMGRLGAERRVNDPPDPWMKRQPFTDEEIQAYKDYTGDQSFNPQVEFFRELENTEFNISFAMRARQIGVMPRPVADAMRQYRRWLYLLYTLGPKHPNRIQELRDGLNKARRDLEKKTDVMKKARRQTAADLEEHKTRIMTLLRSQIDDEGPIHIDRMEKWINVPYHHVVETIKELTREGRIIETSPNTYTISQEPLEPQQLTLLGSRRKRWQFAATL